MRVYLRVFEVLEERVRCVGGEMCGRCKGFGYGGGGVPRRQDQGGSVIGAAHAERIQGRFLDFLIFFNFF